VRVEALARLGASPQVRPGEVERALLVATEILEDLAASGDSDAELCKAAVNVASLFAKLDPQSGPTLVRVGEALITLASDPSRDDEVRRSALNAFPRLQLPDERVLDALENLLETDGRFGSIERDALIGMQLRIHAEGDTAHRRLVELSRDPDEALRFAAATELMNWEWNRKDAPRALERLAAWSAHPDPAVRSESIRKIENLRGLDEHPAALRRRIEHVRTQFENATSPDVRIAAGMALIRLDGAGGRNAGVLPEMISTVPDPTIRRRTRERFADFLADVDESRRADPERIRPVIDAWIEDYLDDVEIVHDALRVAIARRIVPSASSLRAAGRSTSWWIRAAAAGLDAVAGRWNEPTRTRLREALAEGPADLTRFVAEDLPFASEAGPVAAPALEDVWRLLQEIDRHSMFLVMPEGTTLERANDRSEMFWFAWAEFFPDSEIYGQ